MELHDLLLKAEIDPTQVLVLRHRPKEPTLNRVLPWLAAEKPELFNAYQQTQGKTVERAMSKARYVASFIGNEPGQALFVGLYTIGASRSLSQRGYWQVPAHIELRKFGMEGFTEKETRRSVLWFDLALKEDFYAAWKGKLIVRWPPPDRSWHRWANLQKNRMKVLAILEESALVNCMPEWDEIYWTWEDLGVIPAKWKSRLSEWRGIYFIFDESDGMGYVGSASGKENLYQRWTNYANTGHGGNVLLKKRKPEDFRFTILERVSPDMSKTEIISLESKWKKRLHTLSPNGLNPK